MDIQTLIVGILVLGAVLYVGRMLYRQFILGKSDCHCGTDGCPAEKKDD